MTTGEIIRELRTAKKMSQVDLANATGISPSAIAMYERDKRKPKMENLEAIADVFNVDLPYLLGIESKSTYLLDPKDVILQKAFSDRPEMRMLFSVAADCTTEDIIQAIKIIEALKK